MKPVKLDERVLIPVEYYGYVRKTEEIKLPPLFSNFRLFFAGDYFVVSDVGGWRIFIEDRSIIRYLEDAIKD